MAKNRSRRLRKKLYSDEFTVYGFSVSCDLSIEDALEYDVFIDEFIDLIVARNLVFGGGGRFSGFVVAEGRYDSATEGDRSVINEWLSNNPKCTNVEISALVDANYGI